jgi:hypothetical protein
MATALNTSDDGVTRPSETSAQVGDVADRAEDRGTKAGQNRLPAARKNAASARDDLAVAYRRLNAAYQQSLRYAEDVRRLYQQVQQAIYQSLIGLANALEAKDQYTSTHTRWITDLALKVGGCTISGRSAFRSRCSASQGRSIRMRPRSCDDIRPSARRSSRRSTSSRPARS